jgi:hypothetical protein
MVEEGLVQSERWEKPFGGFSEKELTDFSLTSGEILQIDNWRIKNKELRYDYKLHCMSCIDDVT